MFSYDEISIPHGFDTTPSALGSHQSITVPVNSTMITRRKMTNGWQKSLSTRSAARLNSGFVEILSFPFSSGMRFFDHDIIKERINCTKALVAHGWREISSVSEPQNKVLNAIFI